MPELIEVELYAQAIRPVVGQRLVGIDLLDLDYLRPAGADPEALEPLVGRALDRVVRRGKLLVLVFGGVDGAASIGLRFGMTGRLLVDGAGPIDQLVYSSDRDEAEWDRVAMRFESTRVVIRDPRRLGSIDLDPDPERLGPDAATITTPQLRKALLGRTAPLKATLLNQVVIAGLGNLLVDETLWRAGLDPGRLSGELDDAELRSLARAIRTTVTILTGRGGSHTGDTFEARTPGALCPRDGQPLRRDRIGGRTTYWCPGHQR
ncbi:MAG: hypothetical protein KJN63_02280 [Acidimicrobiia bacterium]|nr:hypothetical protein [Acidimicrobiia bacterium]